MCIAGLVAIVWLPSLLTIFGSVINSGIREASDNEPTYMSM